MTIAPLSESSCRAPDDRDARAWEPGYRVRWRHVGAGFAVANWECSGASATACGLEVPVHFEINLQRRGWHMRSMSRRHYVVDSLHHSLWPKGEEFRLSGNNDGGRQAATLVFLGIEGLEAAFAEVRGSGRQGWGWLARRPAVFRSEAVAFCHARLLAAPDRISVEEETHRLLRTFASAATDAETSARACTPREKAQVGRALAYIADRYGDAIDIRGIAAAAGMSPSRISAIFPRVAGTTIWRYVTDLRLHESLHCLASMTAGADLTGLALKFGFNSHSHFSHAFRLRLGCTPSQARQRLQR